MTKSPSEVMELERGRKVLRSAFQDVVAAIKNHVKDDRVRSIALMNVEQGAMWADREIANRIKE